MSALTMTLFRFGFLFLIWAFVYFVVRAMKSDLYGTRVDTAVQQQNVQPYVVEQGAPAPTPVKPARALRLVVVDGPLLGTTIPLASSAILIGRSPSCTLVLDDDYSSSRHARIFPQGDQWFVEDLGSTNGTFLDGNRIQQPMVVDAGIPIRVGQSTIELQR